MCDALHEPMMGKLRMLQVPAGQCARKQNRLERFLAWRAGRVAE